jgi:carbonic anhydrase
MSARSERELRHQITESAGVSADWQMFSVVTDQVAALDDDIQAVRSHPLIPETVQVGGFMYDVDTGLLEQLF